MDFKSVGKRSDDAATDYGHARMLQERSERGVSYRGALPGKRTLQSASRSRSPKLADGSLLIAGQANRRPSEVSDRIVASHYRGLALLNPKRR